MKTILIVFLVYSNQSSFSMRCQSKFNQNSIGTKTSGMFFFFFFGLFTKKTLIFWCKWLNSIFAIAQNAMMCHYIRTIASRGRNRDQFSARIPTEVEELSSRPDRARTFYFSPARFPTSVGRSGFGRSVGPENARDPENARYPECARCPENAQNAGPCCTVAYRNL